MNQVLVIAAHPDDEILGCGGTIANHIEEGDEVHVVILAEGITSRDVIRNQEIRDCELSFLTDCARHAHKILRTTSLILHHFPDNRMDSVDLIEITKTVEKEISRVKPDIVYTHHDGDLNLDHQITHRAVITACRPIQGGSVKKILCFEVSSSTEWQSPFAGNAFNPNYFVEITDVIGQKLLALDAYRSEMRDWPHPRSFKAVEHLARWRGAMVGYEAAESFVSIRQLVPSTSRTDEIKFKELHLIPATVDDGDLLLEWRNDPAARSVSRNKDTISKEEHFEWLKASLINEKRQIFIAQEDKIPIGVVRVDKINDIQELSWTVAPSARGRGLGKKIVSILVTSLPLPVAARVNRGNEASIKIAEYAGMKLIEEDEEFYLFRRDSMPTD